jgi:hypothetical protein
MHEMRPKSDDADAEQIDPDDDVYEAGEQQDEQSSDNGDAGGQHFKIQGHDCHSTFAKRYGLLAD